MSNSNKIWAALGVGFAAILGAAALKAKQQADDKANGTSPEARAFAKTLNEYLAYSRSVRLPGSLTRPEMDPYSEPMPGWNKITDTMPVLKDSELEPILANCLRDEDYYKRFPNAIFCGWRVREESHTENGTFWRMTQTVFVKNREAVQ